MITKEEAIKELTDLLPEEFLMDYADAIRMAIKALEREQCGDCISRKSVSGCVSTMYYKGLGKQKSLEYILKYIERLPAVTPMPKMMKWIKTISENGVTSAVRCSECGFEDNRYELFNYCPKCGAKNNN